MGCWYGDVTPISRRAAWAGLLGSCLLGLVGCYVAAGKLG